MNSKTHGLSIGLSNFNALRLANIKNETNSLEFVRNLCILFLNEKDNDKFSGFSNAYDFYDKLVPKLVHNGIQDNSQTQLNTDIYNILKSINDLNESTYSLSNLNSLFNQIKNLLDSIQATQAAAQAAAQAVVQTAAQAAAQAAVQTVAQAAAQTVAQPADQAAAQTVAQPADQAAAQTVAQPADQAAAQTETAQPTQPTQTTQSNVFAIPTPTITSILSLILSNNLKIINYMNSILSVFPTDSNIISNKQSILTNLSLINDVIIKYFSQQNQSDYQNISTSLNISTVSALYTNLNTLIVPLMNQYLELKNNTEQRTGSILNYNDILSDYKIKLYNTLVDIIISYNGINKDMLYNKTVDPTSNIIQMLTVVNIDKPCFGTVFFSGVNIDYKDPTIDKDDKEKTNIYDKNYFIKSLSKLSENLKNLAYSTNGKYLLPNGFMGNCRLNYGNGIIKFGTFALVNPILNNTNEPMSSIDLSQNFGMIFMAYNPCSDSLSLPQFYN
jgi:hypothetical protein